jgi:undecaprenyl pyrophosphate phosphatase UppP
MKLLHQITGIVVVVLFLLTGQYLEIYYPRMNEVNDGMRMLFRSRHIYILLAGLVNICIGTYFNYRAERWRKNLQLVGSLLLLVSPFLLLAAFFYEPPLPHLQRTFTLPAIKALLAGTIFHLLSGVGHGASAQANPIFSSNPTEKGTHV